MATGDAMNDKKAAIVGIHARMLCVLTSTALMQVAVPVSGQESCWEPLPPTAPQPGPTAHHAMAYDSQRGVAVFFGGFVETGGNAHNETWEWSCGTRTWSQGTPPNPPPARYSHAMTYDSARDVVVLFGGGSSPAGPENELNDTWEYDGTTWAQRSPCDGVVPGKRIAHAMVYDSCRGVTVLFGGHVAGSRLDDTWEWDGTCWTKRAQTEPPPREYPAMAFDTDCCRTILFGGQDSTPHFEDTWAWDGSNWTDVSPAINPTPRYGSGMSYDPARQTFVLFGGSGNAGRHDDTWEFSWDCAAGTWTQIPTQVAPTPRLHTSMVFDETCASTMLFGGSASAGRRDDTWLFPAGRCIPTISQWGAAVLALVVITSGTLVILRRKAGTV